MTKTMSGSTTGSPQWTWPRTPGWCVPAPRTRPGPAPGGRRCGRCRPGRARSARWAARPKADGIEIVTLESTSDYWRIWFFVLEACGLAVQLVHAAQAKNLPGRPKTDLLTELPGVPAGHSLERSFP
jgi:hypothetical protein